MAIKHKWWVFNEFNNIPEGFETEAEANEHARSEALALTGETILIAKVVTTAKASEPRVRFKKEAGR